MDRGRLRSPSALRAFLVALSASLIGALVGCGGDPAGTDVETLALEAPLVSGSNYYVLDSRRDELLVLIPRDGKLTEVRQTFEGQIGPHIARPGGGLLLLTRAPDQLIVLDDAGEVERTLELASAYDTLVARDDGRFVIAYHGPASLGGAERVLFNPNELAIVDLSEPASAPQIVTLQGPRPSTIQYAAPFTLADPNTLLHQALVFATGSVSLLDLTTEVEVDRQRRIPLAEPSLQAGVTPSSTFLSSEDPADPNDLTLYVTATGVDELFAIDLLPADPATGRTIQPAINQVSTGISPGSMHPFVLNGRDKLLIVSRTGAASVSIVDAATGNVTRIPIERGADGALVWEQVENGEVRPQALLYRSRDSIAQFVDLPLFERQGTGAIRSLQLGSSIDSIARVGDDASLRAVARHTNGNGLDVIELDRRAVAPIPSTVTLQEFAIAGDVLFTVATNVERLLAVDLNTQAPSEVPMLAAGERVAVSPESNTLLVDHGRNTGWYSLFDLATFREGPRDERIGVALHGVLDRRLGQGQESETGGQL